MKLSLRLTLAALALLVLLAGARWIVTKVSPAAPATAAMLAPAPATPSPTALQTLRSSPQAQAWDQRQAFETHMREFLKHAPALGAVERTEQARALSASIDQYEANGGLSAGESLLLRIGLIKATVADETQQAEEIAALAMRYREHAEQRMDAYAIKHAADARFQDYKVRERAIVAEVMAMSEVPAGLTRDEYLRQRLQDAREAVYR